MPLCKYLHQNIIEAGGEHDGFSCIICAIRNQNVLDNGLIARVIPEQKRKDYINSAGLISQNCFSHDNRCLHKLSTISINDDFEESINTFKKLTGISNLFGYAEIPVEQINTECSLLKLIKDNYAYSGNSELDFPNHCSLVSFGGKNIKELNQEFKYKTILAKLSTLKKL